MQSGVNTACLVFGFHGQKGAVPFASCFSESSIPSRGGFETGNGTTPNDPTVRYLAPYMSKTSSSRHVDPGSFILSGWFLVPSGEWM